MIYDNTDEVIKKLFESLLSRCQIGLQTSIRGSDFIFDRVHLLYCKFQQKKSKLGQIIYRFSGLDKKQKSNNELH